MLHKFVASAQGESVVRWTDAGCAVRVDAHREDGAASHRPHQQLHRRADATVAGQSPCQGRLHGLYA